MATQDEIKKQIKRVVLIERLQLEDITAEEIGDDTPLFDGGLALDSVEAFEVIVGVEELFGMSLNEVPEHELRESLRTVASIARLVSDNTGSA